MINNKKECYSSVKLEQIKHHLTCAAEISEEVGMFLQTAEIKKVNSEICRMQGKQEDADKLDYSISDLKKKLKK